MFHRQRLRIPKDVPRCADQARADDERSLVRGRYMAGEASQRRPLLSAVEPAILPRVTTDLDEGISPGSSMRPLIFFPPPPHGSVTLAPAQKAAAFALVFSAVSPGGLMGQGTHAAR